MNSSEQSVEAYLKHLALGEVVYEPDGNVPPDFVLDGRIAVEVRRLNQNFEHEAGFEGLEVVEAALYRYVERLLPSFGPPTQGHSWFVFYNFSRPLDWKAVKTAIRAGLKAFYADPQPGLTRVRLSTSVELEFAPSSIAFDSFFVLGAYDDQEAGGWIASEMTRNLNLCVEEKAAKIAAYRSRYPEWWLVMPDHIGAALNAEERSELVGTIPLRGWDRVIILDPKDHTRALEL